MESRKAKKLSSKAPDLHQPDTGQAPQNGGRRLTLVSSQGPGDRTTYNSWQTWPFPKIAVDRIAAAGALGLKAG